MPPGRKPIITRVMSMERMGEIVDGVSRHLETGQQAFWVCPMVHDNEKVDLAAAEERFAALKERFGKRVVLVHGQMKPEEKDAAMERFVAGEAQLMVATTVCR